MLILLGILAAISLYLKAFYTIKLAIKEKKLGSKVWKIFIGLWAGLGFPIIKRPGNEEERVLIQKANRSLIAFWIFFILILLLALFTDL